MMIGSYKYNKPKLATEHLNKCHLNAFFTYDLNHTGGCISISNDVVYPVQAADPAKSAFAKLGGIGKYNHLLGCIDHILVEMRLRNITCRKTQIKIKTVNTYEQLAADHLLKQAFGIWSDGRSGALA